MPGSATNVSGRPFTGRMRSATRPRGRLSTVATNFSISASSASISASALPNRLASSILKYWSLSESGGNGNNASLSLSAISTGARTGYWGILGRCSGRTVAGCSEFASGDGDLSGANNHHSTAAASTVSTVATSHCSVRYFMLRIVAADRQVFEQSRLTCIRNPSCASIYSPFSPGKLTNGRR